MAEPATKQPQFDLSQNKANVMLRKAAEGKYAIAGVCVVSNPSASSPTALQASPHSQTSTNSTILRGPFSLLPSSPPSDPYPS